MQEIKIFLAHTEEVKEDIKDLKLEFDNKEYEKYKIKIKIEDWSKSDKSLSQDRFQQRLNEKLGTCEILYIFFENRIGKFTKEEFEYGLEKFKNNQKPYKMSVFSKKYLLDGDAKTSENENHDKVKNFKDEIKNLHGNQYLHSYKDIDNLKNQLREQLEIDIQEVIEIEKKHKDNPSLKLIKFEGKCPEDIIPIAVKVLKQIDDYLEKNTCFPCTNVQYDSLKKELLENFEDEALQLSIKYLLKNFCITFSKKENLYGNQVEYLKLTTKGDDIIRLRYT